MSIETWFKCDNTDSYKVLIDNVEWGTVLRGIQAYIYEDKLYACFMEGNAHSSWHVYTNNSIPVNQWTHVVITKTGYSPAAYAIYINGVAVSVTQAPPATSTGAAGMNNTLPLNLGMNVYAGSPSSLYEGRLRNMKVYSKALSASEIATNYNGGCMTAATVTANLVYYAKLDEGTGSSIADYSGGNLTSTITNAGWTMEGMPANSCLSPAEQSQQLCYFGATTYIAEVIETHDYYPSGLDMPGRTYQSSLNFPYGYQGQEKDAATGLTNFELRQYDPRISRWYNPDPYGQHHSPYLAMSNNPISFTDPDGGWSGSGNPGNSDDIEWAARFEYMANTQNAFINGDVDSYINGQENMAMVSHAYNEYRAAHTNGNGEWGDWVNGQSARDLGDEMYSYFVADPKKKKENPVLFKLNQLNGGGLDFSGAKFNMSGYENLPWYKTKVDVFGTNAAKSAWNQAVGMTETVANTLFSSDGRKDVFAGVDNLVKGTMNWLFTASTDQKVDDIIGAGTNVHNYENIGGGLMLGYGMNKFGRIEINSQIVKPKLTFSEGVLESFTKHGFAGGRHADLGLPVNTMASKGLNLVKQNRALLKAGDNTLIGNINGIQKSFKAFVKDGKIVSVNMYPGTSNRLTKGTMINFGNITW